MPICAVKHCKKRSNTSNLQKDGVTFHIFPKNSELKKKWTESCNRKRAWEPTRTSTICSLHFDSSQFHLNKKRRKLVDDAVPTLLLTDVEIESHESLNNLKLKTGDDNHSREPGPSASLTLNKKTTIELSPRCKAMKMKIAAQAKKIKKLQSRNRYLEKKLASQQDTLKTLNAEAKVDKEHKLILQNLGVAKGELLRRQIANTVKGKTSRKSYSSDLRSFALTLNYYSPKAYKYIRKYFSTALPHPRTLTKWYATIDGQPGFTQEALNALKEFKKIDPNKKIFCSLIVDEIKIKQKHEWHPETQRYYGYVNYGFDRIRENSEEATDALVFLLVGINTTWKLPIGYFLVKGISAKLKARLVMQSLKLVGSTGVEIKSLTCDGTKTNIAMAEELGCCLDPDNLKTTILDPTFGQHVHFFLDPGRMLKLVRHAFEHYKCIRSDSETEIDWNLILMLHELPETELFNLADKLKTNQVSFKSKIMNIRLPAQLFSESVADALSFCEKLSIPGFVDVAATVEFLKIFNDLYNILDSKTQGGFGYKRAMNQKNFHEFFKKLDETKEFITNLSVDVQSRDKETSLTDILYSPRYTGFLGFCVCIESAKSLFKELVLNPCTGLTYLPFHKISQDHIEILFSKIRNHGGFSATPTARQFENIYKKFLIHIELSVTDTGANGVPLENINILNCSSTEKSNTKVTRITDGENCIDSDSENTTNLQ